MFNWVRKAEMPRCEPTEKDIWAAIDAHDPQGTIDVADRLEQYHDMLVGRDTYRGFYQRSPLLVRDVSKHVEFNDPEQWVTPSDIQFGKHYPLERTLAQIDSGSCDILQPADDIVEPRRAVSMLCQKVLHSNLEWPHDSIVGKIPKPPRGYVTWARYILQAHKATLKRAGIYEAVYASLFDYSGLPYSWARGVAEFWDAHSNTCWIGCNELTITLRELRAVSGLPIYGDLFEECVPPDEVIFARRVSKDGNRRGELILPSVYPKLLHHYRKTYKESKLPKMANATMPISTWIMSFLGGKISTTESACLTDPFDLGFPDEESLSEDTAEPTVPVDAASLARPTIGEDLFLAGFLATWLCGFIMPMRDNAIRCSILLAACKLARGERLSLAPPTLARIFRVLRVIPGTKKLSTKSLNLPWSYIHAWVHMHVQGAFTCSKHPTFFTEKEYPVVMELFRASSTFEKERIRLFFFAPHLTIDRFSLVHLPEALNMSGYPESTVFTDGLNKNGKPNLLYNEQSFRMVEYLLSIRSSWLCHRSGDYIILEGYQPNRVARQFGYTQTTASEGRHFLPGIVDTLEMKGVPCETRLLAASISWAYLMRLNTKAQFYLASADKRAGLGYKHLCWIRRCYGPLMEHGTRRYEPQVSLLGMPSDLRYPPKSTFNKGGVNIREKDACPGISQPTYSSPKMRSGKLQRNLTEDDPPRARRRILGGESPRMPTSQSEETIEPETISGSHVEKDLKGKSVMLTEETYPQQSAPMFGVEEFSRVQSPAHIEDCYVTTYDPINSETVMFTEVASIPASMTSPQYQSSMLCVGETSKEKSPVCTDNQLMIAPEPADLDVLPIPSSPAKADTSSPKEEHHARPGRLAYESAFPYRSVSAYDPQNADYMTNNILFLRSLIGRIHPNNPNFKEDFILKANTILEFIASFGIPEENFKELEDICRAAEYILVRMELLVMVKTLIPLSARKEHAEFCNQEFEYAHHQYWWYDRLLKEDIAKESRLTNDVRDLTSRINGILTELKDKTSVPITDQGNFTSEFNGLCSELKELTCRKSNLQSELDELKENMGGEQNHQQNRLSHLLEVEAASTKANQEVQIAEKDYETLVTCMAQIQDLYNRLEKYCH